MIYPKIENSKQDRNSESWIKLCQYVDDLIASGSDEFSPREYLGDELFQTIYTLPESISGLKDVKKVWLYGSHLSSIPIEIGMMESLEYFDPYTSYSLKWFPYEIMNCKKLKTSRVSTRAFFGNRKNKKPFPDLTDNDFRYHGGIVKCSFCQDTADDSKLEQYWVSRIVGTDLIPLLVNTCSEECKIQIDKEDDTIRYYVNNCHKGGSKVPKAKISEGEYRKKFMKKIEYKNVLDTDGNELQDVSIKNIKPLKAIWKIWEK